MPRNNYIQVRRGSSVEWITQNSVLGSGEPGFDTTNNVLKIGDGVTAWSSLSSIKISSSGISDFNTAVSGLLPVKNIIAGSGVTVSVNNGDYTINSTASGIVSSGTTSEEIDDRVASLLVAGTGINLNYNDTANTLTIDTSGLQPSGNYADATHTHTSSDITNFNSSVSGLLPVKDVVGTGYVSVSGSGGTYTVSVSGLQPSGNYLVAVAAGTGIVVSSVGSTTTVNLDTFSSTIGNGSATSFTVTHNLNVANDSFVTVRDTSTNYYVYPDIKYVDANSILIEFASAPSTNQYRVTVIGS